MTSDAELGLRDRLAKLSGVKLLRGTQLWKSVFNHHERLAGVEPAAALQRREHHPDLVELRSRDQALLPAQVDVRPVRGFIVFITSRLSAR